MISLTTEMLRVNVPVPLTLQNEPLRICRNAVEPGALPHRQRVKGHGEAQVQQRIGGAMCLAV